MASDELQTAFNWRLVRASQLYLDGDFAGALKILQDFWEAHSSEDHDGWLQSAVIFQQADIIRDSGDLTGALRAFRTVNARPENRPFYLLLAHCLAKTLDEMSEAQEAFNELVHRLSEVGGASDKGDLFIVTLYVDLAVRLGRDLPPHHRHPVRDAVRAWEVPLTDSEALDPEQLMAALSAANEKKREFTVNQRRESSTSSGRHSLPPQLGQWKW